MEGILSRKGAVELYLQIAEGNNLALSSKRAVMTPSYGWKLLREFIFAGLLKLRPNCGREKFYDLTPIGTILRDELLYFKQAVGEQNVISQFEQIEHNDTPEQLKPE